MPLCGFNPEMINGLRSFGQGLIAQAVIRAKKDNVSLRESFDRELREMEIMLAKLSPNSSKQEALLGLTHLARALYRPGEGLDDPLNACRENLTETLGYFEEIYRIYYDELRPMHSPEEAIKLLLERA